MLCTNDKCIPFSPKVWYTMIDYVINHIDGISWSRERALLPHISENISFIIGCTKWKRRYGEALKRKPYYYHINYFTFRYCDFKAGPTSLS